MSVIVGVIVDDSWGIRGGERRKGSNIEWVGVEGGQFLGREEEVEG